MFGGADTEEAPQPAVAQQGGKPHERVDEEQLQKFTEIVEMLLAGGYFRARISGLSPFDKVRKRNKEKAMKRKGHYPPSIPASPHPASHASLARSPFLPILTAFLSPLQVIGGMAWSITASNVDVDVDVFFQENSSIGQRM